MKASLSNNVSTMLQDEIKKTKQQRGRVILQMADIRNSQRRNDTITARLEISLKEALRSDLTQRLIDDNTGRKTYEQYPTAEIDQKSSANSSKLMIRPGSKELYMKTVINKLMAKRGSKISRDWLFIKKWPRISQQWYLKVKVNDIIKTIPHMD